MTGLKGKGSEINSEGRRKGVRQRKKRKRISEDGATCSQTVEIKGRRNSCSLTSDFCLTQMLVALTRFAIITSPRSIFFILLLICSSFIWRVSFFRAVYHCWSGKN